MRGRFRRTGDYVATHALLIGFVSLVAGPAHGLLARIDSIPPGSKLRPGQSLTVRATVGDTGPTVAWTVALHSDDTVTVLNSGIGPISAAEVAVIGSDSVQRGRNYRVELSAKEDGGSEVQAEAGFLATDPRFALIPLESGEFSVAPYGVYSVDASGRRVLFSAPTEDPARFSILDRPTGAIADFHVRLGSTTNAFLSSDATRFYYRGIYTLPNGGKGTATGYRDLGSGLDVVTLERADGRLYTVSEAPRRIAFTRPTANGQQYFLLDEASGDLRQLTNAPDAVGPEDGCVTQSALIPLISRGGQRVVIMSPSMFGDAPTSPPSCGVYVYDVAAATLRRVASIPASQGFSFPHLSADGTTLSFLRRFPIESGGYMNMPAIVDLTTGRIQVLDLGAHSAFDAVITGDGTGLIFSNQGDLDERVGNADHNFELFYYDLGDETVSQMTDTVFGLDGSIDGCDPYLPAVSDRADASAFGFYRESAELCVFERAQRAAETGLYYRFVRAVRRRDHNRGPLLQPIPVQTVAAGQAVGFDLRATDPDGDPITLFVQEAGGVDVLPGMHVTDSRDGSGRVVWPTRPENTGTYHLRVAAFDEGGDYALQDVLITVRADPSCRPDCNHDGRVDLVDMIAAVRVSLGLDEPSACPEADENGDGQVSIAELIDAVNAALRPTCAART